MRAALRDRVERAARAAIEQHGALLVYPIANRSEPASLWHALYPGDEMRWAWDESADERVVALWHTRERLASSRQVVYGKWYKGRAVFFSRALFAAMLATLRPQAASLTAEARELLQLLDDDSPQSTKALRQAAGLRGRENERLWTRAMNTLWEQLLIVGTGEVEDGAFPSLAVGATRSIFEEAWDAARSGPTQAQRALLSRKLSTSTAMGKHWQRILGARSGANPDRPSPAPDT